MIPIYSPHISENSIKYVEDALKSGWISSKGKYTYMAADKLADLVGTKYCLLTNNGTAATHLISIGLSYEYPNIKNLIVPSNVYIAAWNTFKISTDYNFICLDSKLETWNADYLNLDQILNINKCSSNNTAFLIVHNIGNIINVPKLKEKYPNYIFVEDNCEGFLGKYENKFSGTESWLSSVSFYANKNLTSGEGGALFINNDIKIYEYLDSVKCQGSTHKKFIFDKLGYNYRMTNIQAAILCGQLEDLNFILENKQRIFDKYKKELSNIDEISFQEIEKGTKHSNWLLGVRFNKFSENKIRELELYLYTNYIETRPMFPPINKHKHFSYIKEKFPISEKLYNSVLIFPSYPTILNKEIETICSTIKEFLRNN